MSRPRVARRTLFHVTFVVVALAFLALVYAEAAAQTPEQPPPNGQPPPGEQQPTAEPPPPAADSTGAPADTFHAAEPPFSMQGASEPVRPPPRVQSRLRRTGEELDRFEFGACVPEGYFDVLGTIGYRRFMREGGPFEQSLTVELAGGHKDYLTEGSLSLLYLFRPLGSYKIEWSIRPLLEIGPGAHLAVQGADLAGFSESAFHAEGFLKTHGYAGVEILLSRKAGLLFRGRVTVPEHKPLDYAQAAIFLR